MQRYAKTITIPQVFVRCVKADQVPHHDILYQGLGAGRVADPICHDTHQHKCPQLLHPARKKNFIQQTVSECRRMNNSTDPIQSLINDGSDDPKTLDGIPVKQTIFSTRFRRQRF